MEVLPALGLATKPKDHNALGAPDGLWNQALLPRYQIAVQSPLTSAMANCCPASTRAPMSETRIVLGVPSGRKPLSLTSGASCDGAWRSITDVEPRTGHGPG